MSIKIIEDGPPIVMKRSEYERAAQEYLSATSYMVNPPSFEEWVRSRQAEAKRSADSFGGLFKRG